jgi:hypothetical protein
MKSNFIEITQKPLRCSASADERHFVRAQLIFSPHWIRAQEKKEIVAPACKVHCHSRLQQMNPA